MKLNMRHNCDFMISATLHSPKQNDFIVHIQELSESNIEFMLAKVFIQRHLAYLEFTDMNVSF